MGADENIDAVDLVEAEPIDRAAQMPLVNLVGAGPTEPLRGQRDPSRLCCR